MPDKKCVILIDGSNVFHSSKRAGKPKCVWPPELDKLLLPKVKGPINPICKIHWFGAADEKNASQERFLNHIEKSGVIVHRYRLKEYLDPNPCLTCNDVCAACGRDLTKSPHREKMVDIAIATTLIELAHEPPPNEYDVFIVVGGDKDHIPAIQYIREKLGKEVYIAGFRDARDLIKNSVAFELDNEIDGLINLYEIYR